MRYALIKMGTVENVIAASPDFAGALIGFDAIVQLAESDAIAPGWSYDGAEFSAPPPAPPSVPEEVTMRQARLALHAVGLLDAAQAVIDALPEPQRAAARIEWEYATGVRRDNPLIAVMISAGLATAEDVDALFVAAEHI